jgi:hypothetical protein
MTTFEVVIGEQFTHRLIVEADNEDKAYEEALKVIRLEVPRLPSHDYMLEPEGFDGYVDITPDLG